MGTYITVESLAEAARETALEFLIEGVTLVHGSSVQIPGAIEERKVTINRVTKVVSDVVCVSALVAVCEIRTLAAGFGTAKLKKFQKQLCYLKMRRNLIEVPLTEPQFLTKQLRNSVVS